MSKNIIIIGLLLLITGCHAKNTSNSEKVCESQVLERIYFGSDSPQGMVSAAQWSNFLKETVTPRFPAGLTVFEGNGQWLGNDKQIVHELSRIVEIVHEDSPEKAKAVQEIAEVYKRNFNQEAVLVLRSDVQACF